MRGLPRLEGTKVEIVGTCVMLPSLGRPWVEPWSWLIGSRAGLSPRMKAINLQVLEVQGFWALRG